MTALFKSARMLLVLTALGALLAGCNRESGGGADQGTPATPPPTSGMSTPPAAAPEPSAAMPPPAEPSGSVAGAASSMAAAAGAVVDDAMITTKVKAALLADGGLKDIMIDVDTSKGDVTLSGAVSSQAQIDKALEIARGVEGVKNVDNKLTVKTG